MMSKLNAQAQNQDHDIQSIHITIVCSFKNSPSNFEEMLTLQYHRIA